jgi:hypothetical protein
MPVGPLQIVEQLNVASVFHRIPDAQAIHRLIRPELPSCPSDAFHTQYPGAMRLGFPHAGVALLIPCILGLRMDDRRTSSR